MKNELERSKLFMNMVIHDLRNPISSIKAGLKLSLELVNDVSKVFE